MTEEDEPIELRALEPSDVAKWMEDATCTLKAATGVVLPDVSSLPVQAQRAAWVEQLEVEIPFGSAYYPCCGNDLEDLPKLLGHAVSDYHFADPFKLLRQRGSGAGDQTAIHVEYIGNVVPGPSCCKTFIRGGQTHVHHRRDGLLALIEDVPQLSVFYYRGDSPGDGGSGQCVLGPVGFHCVLARLLDGGLVCTDGSNAGYWDELRDFYAPWNAMFGLQPFSPPSIDAEFQYFNRRFMCVGILRRQQPVYIWQMHAIRD